VHAWHLEGAWTLDEGLEISRSRPSASRRLSQSMLSDWWPFGISACVPQDVGFGLKPLDVDNPPPLVLRREEGEEFSRNTFSPTSLADEHVQITVKVQMTAEGVREHDDDSSRRRAPVEGEGDADSVERAAEHVWHSQADVRVRIFGRSYQR